jgi:hypothetical protein
MDASHLTKQQALDHLDLLQKKKVPLFGIEILRLVDGGWESSIYKTIWFSSQRGVYNKARSFIRHQMAGEWQMAEFKAAIER